MSLWQMHVANEIGQHSAELYDCELDIPLGMHLLRERVREALQSEFAGGGLSQDTQNCKCSGNSHLAW